MVAPCVQAPEHREHVTPIWAMARAIRQWRMPRTGRFAAIDEVTAAEKINAPYVSRVMRPILLAPDIVWSIPDAR